MYRILLLDTTKVGNASTYKFQLDKKGEIMEYSNLEELDAAVEELLNTVSKNSIIPVSLIDYTIDSSIYS